jgi:cell division septal protein FtsQ
MSPSSSSPDPSQPPIEETRRLLSPQERFGTIETVPTPEPSPLEPAAPDPFVREPISTRLEDEMARRHLPPHERRRHARTLRKREKREVRRSIKSDARPAPRGEIERDFVVAARHEAPQLSARPRRRVPVVLKRLFWLVCLLFLVQLGIAAFSAPQFAIQSVSIVGAGVTPEADLRPLAQRLIGQNFLRADANSIERATEILPSVASARVVRVAQWPPQVQLQITERQPYLKVGAGNDWWVVDQNGVPFRRPDAADSALYAVVAPQFAPALRQKLDSKLWPQVAALNAAIEADNQLVEGEVGSQSEGENGASSLPFWQLRRIYFDKDGLASLRLTGKGALAAHHEMLLRLGDDKWSEKLARARVALRYFERTGRRAQELDLVSLERPVWRPIPAPLSAETKPSGEVEAAG